MLVTLHRDPQQPRPTQSTLGVIECDGRRFQSVELPWIPSDDGPCGVPGKSCIAPGTYRLEARETEARGKHFILSNPQLGVYRYPQNIPSGRYGRSLVLIHAANWAHELLGCIAPGKERIAPRASGNPYDEWMLTSSKMALNELRTLLGRGYDHLLTVEGGES